MKFGIIDVGGGLRVERYNQTVRRALKLEQQGTVCIVAPDSTEGMSTLTKDKQALEAMYQKGYRDAENLMNWYTENRKLQYV